MNSNINKIHLLKLKDYIVISLVIISFVFLQIWLINKTELLPIVVILPLIILLVIVSFKIIDFNLFLLILAVIPLIYLERAFSRDFSYIFLQNLPLYILCLLGIFKFLSNDNVNQIKINYVLFPVVIYSVYSIFLTFLGLVNSAINQLIIIELYQNLYFLLAIPIYFLLRDRKQYVVFTNIILIIFSLIAIQYLVVNLLVNFRFTTYHNHFFPFTIAISTTNLLLVNKFKYRVFNLLCLILFWGGSFATQTRTLLVANLIATFLVLMLYMKVKKIPYAKTKILFIILFLIFGAFLFKSDSPKSGQLIHTTESTERIASITNPTGEISFLMRVETAYLGMKKILQKPILGYGFGYQLQMKYLLDTKFTFPDNNYIYYLLKGGIPFLLIALFMFFRFMNSTWLVIKNSNEIEVITMMIGIFSGFIALMFFGLMNANLVKLKLNLLYAFYIAFSAFEYKNLVSFQSRT